MVGKDIRVVYDTDKLDYLADHILEELAGVVLRVTEEAVSDAKRRAPVDTGELRDSIGYELGEDGLTAELTVDADHGVFQELGTKYVQPQPFLAPAMDAAAVKLRSELGRVIEDTARKG